jgi:hypothetical protein
MRLDKVVKGKIVQPVRVTIYGPEGVGKSTFGAGAPKAIYLGPEDGTANLDVTRFPAVEPMIWDHICQRDGMANVEAYGYGKGYQVALDEWRKLLSAIEQLRKVKPMHVVLVAHSVIKPFKNPAGDDFDRYELKLNAKASGLIKEWSDAVLFANWETFAKKDDKTKRVKGVSTGARLLYTERKAAYDAKNRYSLPEELPLSWGDFEAAVNAGAVAPVADLKAEIIRKAAELGGDIEAKILATVEKAGDNAESLALINNKCNARLAERAELKGAQQ